MERVVATGRWLYDGLVHVFVHVVELDYDFWYGIGEADGDLADGEVPLLNADGALFYVRHKPGWSPGEPFWPDSQGFETVGEAKAAAQARVGPPITWD